MVAVTNAAITIVRNVANANVTVTHDVNWSQFDRPTTWKYSECVRLIGGDAGQDGDNGVVGDNSIFTGLVLVSPVIRSNGQAVTARRKNFAFANLREDGTLPRTEQR